MKVPSIMSKKRCHFCEDFAMLKSNGDTPSEIKSVYLATLVRKLIVNGRVKSWCDYGSYKLRFCPECGRKIEQETSYEKSIDKSAKN